MRSSLTVTTAVLVALFAGDSWALDKVKNVKLSQSPFAGTPVIRVENDGHRFTDVQGSTTYAGVGSAECKGANKIQDAEFGLGAGSIGGGFFEVSPGFHSAPVGGTGGKSLSGGFSVVVPADKAGLGGDGVYTDPVALCNAGKDKRVEDGQAAWDVLKNGFSTSLSKKISLAVRCQFNHPVGDYADLVDWEQKTISVPVTVECAGNPSVKSPADGAAGDIAAPFQIAEASLDVEAEAEGYCVKGFEVPVGVRIRSNGAPGEASFRLAKDGAWGGITNLRFTKSDTDFKTEIKLRIPPADMDADGELGQFTATPGPAAGPAQNLAAPAGPKVHELQLKILEPHAKIWDTKTVKIRCTGPRRNPALGDGPAGLTSTQRPPVAPSTPEKQARPAPAKPQRRTTGIATQKPMRKLP
jgi:hypothetical protein